MIVTGTTSALSSRTSACGRPAVPGRSPLWRYQPGRFRRPPVDETVSRWSRLDVLVNNADVIHRHTAETSTDEEWDDVMAVYVTALFRLCRAGIKAVKRNGGGAIVNIGSDRA